MDDIEALSRSASGQHFFAGDHSGNVYRFEILDDGEMTNAAQFPGHIQACVSIAADATGSYLLTGSWDGTARFWELAATPTGIPKFLSLGGANGRVNGAAFAATDKWIAVATDDGSILLWETDRCRLILHATGGALPAAKSPIQAARPVLIR
jgi:WD40 repeat protein